MHSHTLYGAVRPFGVSVLLVSYENDEAKLFTIEPSGVYYGYHGISIGKAAQNAKTEIEKIKVPSFINLFLYCFYKFFFEKSSKI
jgi:20S proteasome subunit alpha 7